MKRESSPNGTMTLGTLPPETAWKLQDALAGIQRRFGAGAISRLGDAGHLLTTAISTGFPGLDKALGVGGLPRGRIVDIYGPESAGKTTLCLHIIAQAQQLGGRALIIDTDHALDLAYARRCGVAVDGLYLSQPDSAEEALEIADVVIDSGCFAVVVIDSAASLVTRAELSGAMGDEYINYGSLMSQALRKLAGKTRQTNTLLIFTNQLRCRPGNLLFPETSTGGRALRSYASVRIEIRSIKPIKRFGGQVIGQRVRAVIKKNKVAAPLKEAEFEIYAEDPK